MCGHIFFQLEAVNTDYEKMLKSNNRLQKIALTLEDEKNFLQNEVDRLTKELETRFIELFSIFFFFRCTRGWRYFTSACIDGGWVKM